MKINSYLKLALNKTEKKLISKSENICIQLINLVPYNNARVRGLIDFGFNCKCLLNFKNDLFKPLSINSDSLDTKVISSVNRNYNTYKIIRYIFNNDFKAIFVSGYLELSSLSSIVGSFIKGNKIILFSESQEIDKKERNFFVELYKKQILKIFDSAVVGGESHKKYLIKLGMKKNLIFKGYDCVDNDFFISKSEQINQKKCYESYVCCVCRFVEKKNLFTIIDSFIYFKNNFSNSKNTKLKIAGTGPLQDKLMTYVKSLKIKDIEFVGPVNYKDLPEFYANSKGMILLSTSEQWGLVTNEALNCGIPVLISEKCGSSELIKENINGYIVNTNDIFEVAKRIKDLIELAKMDITKFECRNSIRDISTLNFAKSCFAACNNSKKNRIKKMIGFTATLLLLLIKNLRFNDLRKFEA